MEQAAVPSLVREQRLRQWIQQRLFVLGDDIYKCIQTREVDYEDTRKEMDSVQNVLHKIPKPE